MNNSSIILATVNARYSHAAFGLRWLWANMGPLRERTMIREFVLGQPPLVIAEALLAANPRLVGFGVYIWNVTAITQIVQILKAVRPDLIVVVGGPEVSYEYENTPLFASADYLIQGEADAAFGHLAEDIIEGRPPSKKVIAAEVPDLTALESPYPAYTEEDLTRRLTYVEASRGCPFRCAFCMSSLAPKVREFPLEPFLDDMTRLIERGARRFKFVDRTFNLDEQRVETILQFFLDHWQDGMGVHFEIVPDRLSENTLEWIARFPPGGLRLEAGVQTFNSESQTAIARRQDLDKTLDNLRFLREHTHALIHADLLVGLPAESWESFAAGFDRLIEIGPQEMQIGILKRLKGAPITQQAAEHDLVFTEHPPYEILQTDRLDFAQVQRLKRFARYFDIYYNSGNFPRSLPLLWRARPSAFDAFMALSDKFWAATGRTHQLSLERQTRHLYQFLVTAGVDSARTIADTLTQDFHRLPGRKEKLSFPKEFGPL